MKKYAILLLLLAMTIPALQAQSENRSSVGINLQGSLGLSAKAMLTDHLFLMTDINFRPCITGDTKSGVLYLFWLESSANIFYQKKFKETSQANIFWFAGGGISGGWDFFDSLIKLGVNTIAGFEFGLKRVPLSFQLDLRPGYGLFLAPDGKPNPDRNAPWFTPNVVPFSFFDWSYVFSIRYTFNNKK